MPTTPVVWRGSFDADWDQSGLFSDNLWRTGTKYRLSALDSTLDSPD
ncbi:MULTISPECIES: hypothetical protein [unclassified Arthrobacter]|nr:MULTISPECIES: hypothetical protein [unclassified Arthrobacter]